MTPTGAGWMDAVILRGTLGCGSIGSPGPGIGGPSSPPSNAISVLDVDSQYLRVFMKQHELADRSRGDLDPPHQVERCAEKMHEQGLYHVAMADNHELRIRMRRGEARNSREGACLHR